MGGNSGCQGRRVCFAVALRDVLCTAVQHCQSREVRVHDSLFNSMSLYSVPAETLVSKAVGHHTLCMIAAALRLPNMRRARPEDGQQIQQL